MGNTSRVGSDRQQVEVVGRRDELAALERWLDEAVAGSPRIVMLSGDPGMGKTFLLRSLTERAQHMRIRTAWGTAIEGIEVPFLAASSLLSAIPGGDEALVGDARSAGSWGSYESQNLVMAINTVRRAAAAAPLLLVIDDVQWLDEASAAFLQHLAVVIGTADTSMRVLVAVSVRTGGGSEAGLRTVRRLGREPIARRLQVGPLDEIGTRELCNRLTGDYPTREALRDLLERTGGCPLLVRARLFGSNDAGGHQSQRGDDLYDLLEGRLASLSLETRRAVEALAMLGDRVAVSALPVLIGSDWGQTLDGAFESGLLVDDEDEVCFEHSLYRYAVLQSLSERRAAALRAEVAVAVSTEPLRSLLAPAVVAVHLRRAGDAVPAEIAASIGWEAGSEAYIAGAWGQASDYFEESLRAADAAGLDWADRVDRWYRAGEAAFRDHDFRCVDLLRTSLEMADADTDIDTVVQATVLLTRALLTLGTSPDTVSVERDVVELAERDDPRLDRWRSTLFGIVAECRDADRDAEAARRFVGLARRAARPSDDPLGLWAVEMGEGLHRFFTLSIDAAGECFERAVELSSSSKSQWHEASSRHRVDLVNLVRGDLVRVDETLDVGMDVARSCHHWAECSFGGAIRTMMRALRADEAVEVEAESAAAMYRRTSYMFSPSILYPALACARATRGDLEGARDALRALEDIGQRAGPHWRILDGFEQLLTGVRSQEAVRPRALPSEPTNVSRLASLASAADAALAFVAESGDVAVLDPFVEAVDEVLSTGTRISPGWPHFFPRIRAELALARHENRANGAIDWAIEIAVAQRLQFEMVMLDLLRSRAATDRADDAEFASSALRRADRSGLLTGVAAAQRRLMELGAPHEEPLARLVLNTDIVSSTEMTRTLGDEAWLDVLDEHDALVRSSIRRNGGVIFKHTGDGMFAWFVTADEGIRATRSILSEFDSRQLHHGSISLQLRVGMSLGSPLGRSDGDLFGMTVIEAARLCAAAPAGTGLAAASVAESTSLQLVPHGPLGLKGFDNPVETYTVTPVS